MNQAQSQKESSGGKIEEIGSRDKNFKGHDEKNRGVAIKNIERFRKKNFGSQ